MLEVYIDGACEPVNPGGTASYGVAVLKKEGVTPIARPQWSGGGALYRREDITVWEEGKVVGSGPKMSNNVAEYAGLIAFLKWYGNYSDEEATIFSDSQLLVNQMSRKWKVRKGLYVPYFQEAFELLAILVSKGWPKLEFKWIPRDDNTFADALAVKALAGVGIVRRK